MTNSTREPEARSQRLDTSAEPTGSANARATESFTMDQLRLVRRELLLADAREALAGGELGAAAERFEDVLATDPGCSDAAQGLAEVVARRRDSRRGYIDRLQRRRR